MVGDSQTTLSNYRISQALRPTPQQKQGQASSTSTLSPSKSTPEISEKLDATRQQINRARRLIKVQRLAANRLSKPRDSNATLVSMTELDNDLKNGKNARGSSSPLKSNTAIDNDNDDANIMNDLDALSKLDINNMKATQEEIDEFAIFGIGLLRFNAPKDQAIVQLKNWKYPVPNPSPWK
jgi:hypothetical protein